MTTITSRYETLLAALVAEETAEAEVREFVEQFPTPNALRALDLCETGRLAWSDVRDLFARSLSDALETVRR